MSSSRFDHTGSSFDDFLEEEGMLETVDATARARTREWIERVQREACKKHDTEFLAAPDDSKLGFAAATEGKIPINGLRHPSSGDTSGWYLWCGTEFSDADDFFVPLHLWHIYEKHPELTSLLGLPPGFRFLVAGDYIDVWYDATLLEI